MDAAKVKFGTVQITSGKISRVAPEGGAVRPIDLPGKVVLPNNIFQLNPFQG
jgi:hypothetical protein